MLLDVIAEDLDDLLKSIDGRIVSLPEREEATSLQTQDMELTRLEKTFLESFLEFLADPNVSFLLLTLGGLGLVVELFNPGLIIPGLIGVIFLILAFLAFGNLPVNWAAAAFIVLAIVLAVLETQVAGFGVLGVGSIICLALGGVAAVHSVRRRFTDLAQDWRKPLAAGGHGCGFRRVGPLPGLAGVSVEAPDR